MKKARKILFTAGLIAILVIISILCFIFGRGHTVYLDNKDIDGYKAYQFIDVNYKGDNVTTLAKNERTVVSCIGQKLTLDLVVTEKRNSMDEEVSITIKLPYSMNDITINLNSYLSGAQESEYLSEFIPLMAPVTADEEIDLSVDDMGLSE